MSVKERIFKYLAGFTYTLLGLVLVLVVSLGAFIYMMPACHNAEALARAKAVPAEQWAQIYEEAEVLIDESPEHYLDIESLPENIASLKPMTVIAQGASLWVYLAACGFDDKVIVAINASEKRGQNIHVQWGDPVESLNLWQKRN